MWRARIIIFVTLLDTLPDTIKEINEIQVVLSVEYPGTLSYIGLYTGTLRVTRVFELRRIF